MKKGRKLTRRILSIVLTAALVVGLMPGNMLTVLAEGAQAGKSEEIVVETVSSNDASAMTECTCETDDPAFHATNCPAYIAPENPQCYCAEKCTEDTLNVWCDVCGMQGVSACQGEDTAVAYEIVASGNCGAEGNGSNVTWTLDSEGTLTISGTGAMADYELVVDDYPYHYTTPWHNTDNDGRYQNSNIKKVVVEEGVTHIGSSAFKDFTELTSISIPNTVKSIGNGSVSYCEKLTSLVIPDSVTSIGEEAFYQNIMLTSVTIGNSVESIGDHAFYRVGCNAGTNFTITLPKSVTSIAPSAFTSIYKGATIRYSCSYNEGNGYSTGNNTFNATLKQYHLYEYSSSGNKINCSRCTCGEYSSSTATLSLSSDEPIYYTGEEIKPAVTVTYPDGWGGDKIEPSKNNCNYSNNINAGTATCTFKYAEGVEASLDFTIAECPHWGVDSDGMCDNCDYLDEPERVDEYYQIANAGNLMWFAQQVNEGRTAINAKLTADIDMKDIDWTTMSSFAGTLDGDGHTILYLCADENGGDDDIADGSRCGLFQTLSEGGTVTNLTISGAQLWSANSAGAIAAVNNGTISKCTVKDSTIELGASHGLSAIAGTNTGTVTDCGVVNCFLQRRYSAANSNTFAIGVVVEDNSGTVSNCFSYGCTFSNSPNLYAIVESGNAPVNCYYYTDATVSDTVATAKTVKAFASGEVAYLLNGSSSENVTWYQKLLTDTYPVLDSKHGIVYYGYISCDDNAQPEYSNQSDAQETKPDHVEGKDVFFTLDGEIVPTCTERGVGHTECEKCHKVMQTNVTVEASGHTGGTATCKNKAECSVCHEGYGELDKNNHAGETEVKDAKKATCAADGYTGDTYCKDCGAKIATGTKVAALGAPKKGVVAKSDKATYKVTKSDLKNGTAAYVGPLDKKATKVNIPATVKIDGVTFKVTSIEKNAFKNNKKVKTVTVGKNVTTIGDNAFYKCTALTKISIPSKVKTIGKNAFYGCKKMTSATIGKGVSKIGAKAFYGCSKLKTLKIKTTKLTTKKIGSKAFSKTPKSMKVTVPKKKFKTYKSMLIKKGVNKKASFKKS